MQNRTVLVIFRPIFCEKLKIAPPYENSPPQTFESSIWAEKSVSNSVKTSFFFFRRPPDFGRKSFEFRISAEKSVSKLVKTFFFWRPHDFGRKKRLNFRAFREIPHQFSDKPCETDSRSMKIRIKVVCKVLTLSK